MGRGQRGGGKLGYASFVKRDFRCETCGLGFSSGGLNPRFCSRPCLAVGQRKVLPDRTCDHCEAVIRYEATGSHRGVTTKHWFKIRFCSQPCATAHQRKNRRSKLCEWCELPFSPEPPHRFEVARFCSPRCASDQRNRGKTSECRRFRKTPAYIAWRTSVFERDNYTCQACGRRGGTLNADHVKSFAFHPELRLDLDNGRTLCVSCHRKTDNYGTLAWRNKPVGG